ncbi:MAG: hypothetical protein FWF02_08530 [Micrococcales bacterium]|nr:hypothetical protein [Micrococcales bacterium]MCL2667734.1 hypothetical protein [Micrococcales bacterium]
MNTLVEILPQLLVMSSDSSDDGGGIGWLLLSGPAAGIALYGALYRFYRNTDKSHNYEHETRVVAKPIRGDERKVDKIHGTSDSHTKGHNEGTYRQRVTRLL